MGSLCWTRCFSLSRSFPAIPATGCSNAGCHKLPDKLEKTAKLGHCDSGICSGFDSSGGLEGVQATVATTSLYCLLACSVLPHSESSAATEQVS
eukprot:symbB.v1.2.004317.t1/scaffold188.1/size279614/6